MIEQRWGSALTVGLEEEIFIVDAESFALAPAVETVVSGAADANLPGKVKTELFASVVELNTDAREGVAGALESLRALRAAAARVARANGLALAAVGSHPFSDPEEQEIADEDRYREFVDYAGATARRQGVSGLHVHLGMESADACFHALEAMLPWLPVVLALSANSPYLSGRETGLLSTRAEILGILPRHGAPPPFADYDQWERFAERLTSLDVMRDYTTIWWDLRPHPRYGTLEVRMPDQPTLLERTGAFAALLQALAATVLDEPRRAPDAAARPIFDQNRWAAARFGPRAQLVHPERDGAASASDLWHELRERVDLAARRLGVTDLIAPLDDPECEADRQLDLGRRDGLAAVCADVVARTNGAEPSK